MKEKSGHSEKCESAQCKYKFKNKMVGIVGCTWVGNRKERDTHECALSSPDQAFQTLCNFVQFVSEKLEEDGIDPLVEAPDDDRPVRSKSQSSEGRAASMTPNSDASEL